MPSCQVRVSSNLVQRRASSPSGVAAVGAGTRCPVTGAARAVDGGFRRTAPHTAILAGGFPTMAWKTPTVGEAITASATIGGRSHIPITAGEVPPAAGVIRSQDNGG